MPVSHVDSLSLDFGDASARLDHNHQTSSISPHKFLSIATSNRPVDSLARSVLIQGHAMDALDLLPEQSIQTVVTSPPYWSLRDYDVDQQIGCDESLEDCNVVLEGFIASNLLIDIIVPQGPVRRGRHHRLNALFGEKV